MGTFVQFTYGICPPTDEHQCQAKRNGAARCRHKAKEYIKYKPTGLVIEVCKSHAKRMQESMFGWRHVGARPV